jgi:CHASE3 domain sensor protein
MQEITDEKKAMRKTCTKCGAEKEESEFRVYKNGYQLKVCKQCVRDRNNAYMRMYNTRPETKERMREYNKEYSKKNRKKKIAHTIKWQKSNKKKVNETGYEWKRKNPEIVKRIRKNWLKKSPDKIRKYAEKNRNELSDTYVRSVMRQTGWPKGFESAEIIEAVRLMIKTKRELKKNINHDS